MKLHRLAVKGLTVYSDEQIIDFDALPSGVIAIVGKNGEGKTSLMEAIFAALYRELPTRPGTLYPWFSGRDGKLELDFTMNGERCRSTVLVDAVGEKAEAYFRWFDSDKKPTNGKLGPFDKAVLETVGPKALLLSSVIGTQDRSGSFLDLPVADRKALFVSLLGIGHCTEIEKQAKAKAEYHTTRLEANAVLLSAKERQAEAARAEAGEVTEVETAISLNERHATTITEALHGLRQEYVALSGRLGMFNSIEQEMTRLEGELKTAARTRGDVKTKLNGRLAAILEQNRQIEASRTEIGKKIAELDTRIINNKILLEMEPGILNAVTRAEQIGPLLDDLRQELVTIAAHDTEVQRAQGDHQRSVQVMAQLDQNITWNKTLSEELQTIPCHGKPPYDKCVKITTSLEARRLLPELIQDRNNQESVVEMLRTRVEAVPNGCRTRDAVNLEIKTLESERVQLQKDLKYRDAVKEARAKIDGYTEQIKLLTVQNQALQIVSEADDAMVIELRKQVKIEEARVEGLQDRINALHAQLADKHQILAERASTEEKIRRAEQDSKTVQDTLFTLKTKVSMLQRTAREAKTFQTEADAIRIQVRDGSSEVSDWQLLSRAFGPSGIPQLEIDCSGPGISSLANDLLAECYSTRFTLRLSTQREAADGKRLIEDFDCLCLDQKIGKWQSIDALSGGEKIVVAEALSMAISVYNKGSREYLTCLRDETTGALDPVNAVAYIAMLRKARQLGHFEKIIFVTHNAECSEIADARLRCANGKVSIEL